MKTKIKVKTAKDILLSHDWLERREKSAKYISTEHQDFGLRLSYKLNDPEHKSLYIKLAKTENRNILEKAISFTLDYPNAENKAKIFMWKLKEIKNKLKANTEKAKDKQIKFI